METPLPPVRGRIPPELQACPACRQFVKPGEAACPHCGASLRAGAPSWAYVRDRLTELRHQVEALLPQESGARAAPDFQVTLPARTWDVMAAAAKLEARASLPGACAWDACAESLRQARARGLPASDRVALALPASWLVNSQAPSPLFQKWLSAPLRGAWVELVGLVEGGPAAWAGRTGSQRAQALNRVRELCLDGHGLAAVSKVLALLAPETVPLMDDAAIAFLTGGVPVPEREDAPSAGPDHFLPVMDAFTRAVRDAQEPLEGLCRTHTAVPLEPAQALDRLLWFDSWGIQFFAATIEDR